MRNFTAFRTRILAVLGAAGVAQACGGTAAVFGKGDGTDDPPVPPPNEPGCTPDVDARLAASKSQCGGGAGYCSGPFDATECIAPTELASSLRPCAAPPKQGSCPAPNDVVPSDPCSVITGAATLMPGGQCCYQAKRLSCAVPGRALRVNGLVCLPDVVVGRVLAESATPDEPQLDSAARQALAELWCEGGRYEHASVAAFARTTLQLLALQAPTELVAASQAASLDEIEHARLCFALASRFAGRELRAGRLAAYESFTEVTLAELAAETVVGGCIGETVAALTASVQLGGATDPDVRYALQRIAEDETRHAELAWRIVAWASDVGGPEVRAAIASAFETALAVRATTQAGDREAVARESHGQLSQALERAIRDRVLSEIVAPCADALLAA